MDCQHKEFASTVSVNRLTKGEDGPVTNYSADIKVFCVNCGMYFCFVGVPCGFSYGGPTCSIDGTELRIPIIPVMEPMGG